MGDHAVAVNAGALNHLFALQSPTPGDLSPDAWTTVDDMVWGEIKAVSQRESLRFGVPLSEGQFVITVYYRSDVRASYRMTEPDSDRTFQILGYSDPTGALEQLDLLVVEVL
jgi:head-tail adaptor